jgi:hypothetical protein
MEFCGSLRVRDCHRRRLIRLQMLRGSMTRPLSATSIWTRQASMFSKQYWAQLTFRHNFNLEASDVDPDIGFDGAVLEISSFYINNGEFTDITDPAVGGSFITGGYNRTISSDRGSPIAGRRAWSGDSGGFITTMVSLPTLVIDGVLRWRMASDNSGSGEGWRVDNITGSYCHFTGLPSPTPPSTPTVTPTVTPRPRPKEVNVIGDL